MFTPRVAAALVLFCAIPAGCAPGPGGGSDPMYAEAGAASAPGRDEVGDAVARGRQLTSTSCAGCHATGATGSSPLAAATPFRDIVHRYPLDQLEEAFAEGVVTGHPDMPAFVFRASEIDDLIAYLQTLKRAS